MYWNIQKLRILYLFESFLLKQKKFVVYLFAFYIFSMTQYNKEKSSMKYSLNSTKGYHYTIAFQKWLIYVWFGAIQKLDSELHGTKFLVILLSNKCWNQNLKIFNTVSSYYCFDERYYFCLEARIFCENADISKI